MSCSTGQPLAKPCQSNGKFQGLEKESVQRVVTKKTKKKHSTMDPNSSNSEDPKSASGELPEGQAKAIEPCQEEGASKETPVIKLKKNFNPNTFYNEHEDGEMDAACMSKEEPFANTYGKKRTYKSILAESKKRLKLANASYR
ncbi:hypothetical protein O181_000035 [Austropuccinia psidii MF-1]|uniref:Uncharacterized protein n=1 Tax=Austropuccinia psidii MF-1 TaxID=1389203 RepID=A0A9Q3B851_9BASI|nr:hypothetical protein [Austropuccinia psidii MF-1]